MPRLAIIKPNGQTKKTKEIMYREILRKNMEKIHILKKCTWTSLWRHLVRKEIENPPLIQFHYILFLPTISLYPSKTINDAIILLSVTSKQC